MKTYLYTLFLFLFLTKGFAQTLDFKFKALNNDIVISSNSSPYIYKDSKGLTWISTMDGVNVYDGQNVEIHKQNSVFKTDNQDLGGNIIQGSFFEDKNTDIWFTTYNAINCYRRAKNSFEHYFLFDEKNKRCDVDYWGVFLDKQHNFWIEIEQNNGFDLYSFNTQQLSQTRFGSFDTDDIEIFEVDSLIVTLYQQRNNDVFLSKIKDNKIVEQTKILDNAALNNENIRDFLLLHNSIYFTNSKGLFVYDLANQKVSSLINGSFLRILSFKENQLLITATKEIVLFDTRKKVIIEKFPNEDIGITNPISCLLLDKEGGLWATNEFQSGNIYFANTKKKGFHILHSRDKQLPVGNALCLNAHNEVISVNGNTNKLLVFNTFTKELVKTIPLPKGSVFKLHSICCDTKNNIYYSSKISLFQYNSLEKKWKTIPIPRDLAIWNLQKMSDSRVFACTSDGLYEIIGTTLHKITILNHATSDITYLFQDSKGFIHFSQNANDYFIAKFVNNNTLEVIKTIPLNGFFSKYWENPKANEIWLATNIGIAQLNTDNYELTVYGEKRGLKNQFISAIYPDHADNLWAATNQGVLSFNIKTKKSIYFDKSDGLGTENFMANNSLATPNNELWFGGETATIFFNPDEIKLSTYQAPIHIRTFNVNDIRRNDINLNNDNPKVNLNYDENTFNLQLLAIDLTNPLRTKIAYFLEGWDMKWDTTITANGFIRYSNLSHGQYYLHLASCNADGIWASEIKKISIYIKPPFYKTWWFRGLCILLFLVIAYYLYLRQINRIKESERKKGEYNTTLINSELKALKAQINPHFFNNCLNSISNFILKNDTDNAFFYLTKFSRLVRLVLEHSNTNFIKLNDEIAALTYYLEMESLRFSSKFEYKIEINKNVDASLTFVSPMLVQPFVENAIWHGLLPKKGGIVVISFEKEDNYVKCTIEDNGIGRVKSAENNASVNGKRKSYGMSLIESRLELLYQSDKNKPKDVISIIDLYDNEKNPLGTKIVMKIPTQIYSTQKN